MGKLTVSVVGPMARKVNVELMPNEPLSKALKAACDKFKLDASNHGLAQGKKAVSLDTIARLSGLVNRATLTLIEQSKAATSAVSLAVQLPNRQRVKLELAADTSLEQAIKQALSSASIDQATIASPVLRYMRRELHQSEFTTTTLSDIGISSGRALVSLDYQSSAETKAEPATTSIADTSATISSEAPLPQQQTGDGVSLSTTSESTSNEQLKSQSTTSVVNAQAGSSAAVVDQTANSSSQQGKQQQPAAGSSTTQHQATNSKSQSTRLDASSRTESAQPAKRLTVLRSIVPANRYIPNMDEDDDESDFSNFKFPDKPAGATSSTTPSARPSKRPTASGGQSSSTLGDTQHTSAGMDITPEPACDRLVKIFRFQAEVPTEIEVDDSALEVTTRDLDVMLQVAKSQASEKPLLTQALRDKAEQRKAARYEYAMLRIQLPDRSVIQARFTPKETIAAVMSQVAQCLTPTTSRFELYTTPPRTILRPEQTLQQLRLYPLAKVFASFEGHYQLQDANVPVYDAVAEVLQQAQASVKPTAAANEPASGTQRKQRVQSSKSGNAKDKRKNAESMLLKHLIKR